MVVGGLAIAADGALAQDVAIAIATKASLDYMDAVFSTSGTVSNIKQRATFKKLADIHSTLGYAEQLIRQTFAMSPLMKRMRETTLVRGIVYIAYVPPGKGKTTSCKAFLRTGTISRPGIAFCPCQSAPPYAKSMARLLSLNAVQPPLGWMACLIEALKEKRA
jgi:hypothetical protein